MNELDNNNNIYYKLFQKRKYECLYNKIDKSSVGGIDIKALDICNSINSISYYYTTSSCSGRCFWYTGSGNKSGTSSTSTTTTTTTITTTTTTTSTTTLTTSETEKQPYEELDDNKNDNIKLTEVIEDKKDQQDNDNNVIDDTNNDHNPNNILQNGQEVEMNNKKNKKSDFIRCRISHDLINDPIRYFNINTINTDRTGGGDNDISIATTNTNTTNTNINDNNEDNNNNNKSAHDQDDNDTTKTKPTTTYTTNDDGLNDTKQADETSTDTTHNTNSNDNNNNNNRIWWLRYEPFILHVACYSMDSAKILMDAARPSFKNVALTSWNHNHYSNSINNNNASNNDDNNINTNHNDDVDEHNNNSINIKKKNNKQLVQSLLIPKYVVVIWGDEGIDMPLTNEIGNTLFNSISSYIWLQQMINEKHKQNWNKMYRFLYAIQQITISTSITSITTSTSSIVHEDHDNDDLDDVHDIHYIDDDEHDDHSNQITIHNNKMINNSITTTTNTNSITNRRHRSFDVIGDVAIVTLTESEKMNIIMKEQQQQNDHQQDLSNIESKQQDELYELGQYILNKNHAIQYVVGRYHILIGYERKMGPLYVITTRSNNNKSNNKNNQQLLRRPFMTTHKEYNVSCVIDLENTFYNPRMAQERIRFCEHVINYHNNNINNDHKESILIVFGGVCMEAIQLVARNSYNNIETITIIEQNIAAIQCAKLSIRMLRRNKAIIHNPNDAANKIILYHGDVLDIIPQLTTINTSTSSSSDTSPPPLINHNTNNQSEHQNANESHDKGSNNSSDTHIDTSSSLPPIPQSLSSSSSSSLQQTHSLLSLLQYDRIIAPRPKEGGTLDGDIGTGDHGAKYLQSVLTVIKKPATKLINQINKIDVTEDVVDNNNTATTAIDNNDTTKNNNVDDEKLYTVGGIIHWYDFVSQDEYPLCIRTCQFLKEQVLIYSNHTLSIDILSIVKVGSTVAKKQLRICVDFCIIKHSSSS